MAEQAHTPTPRMVRRRGGAGSPLAEAPAPDLKQVAQSVPEAGVATNTDGGEFPAAPPSTSSKHKNSNVIAFRAPHDPIPNGRPVCAPLKVSTATPAPRPRLSRAQFLEGAMLLTDFARQMGLAITVHPQGDVA